MRRKDSRHYSSAINIAAHYGRTSLLTHLCESVGYDRRALLQRTKHLYLPLHSALVNGHTDTARAYVAALQRALQDRPPDDIQHVLYCMPNRYFQGSGAPERLRALGEELGGYEMTEWEAGDTGAIGMVTCRLQSLLFDD